MEEKRNKPDSTVSPGEAIPSRIVIGVTGHRKIENPILLGATMQTVLKNIRQMAPTLESTPLLLSVLSPLAEGADRLIAREVLKTPGSLLEVILPLENEAYIEDFKTEASKKEFEEMLGQAKSVRVLPHKYNRPEAYEQVGRYIVEQCDVLIALWDGKPSAERGGTQEIVEYARENKCPLIWINSEDYSQIHFETGRGLDPRPFHDLDDYNRRRINLKQYDTQLKHEIKYFSDHAEHAGIPLTKARPTIEYLMSHYVRGDRLALYYQHLYYQSETYMYSLALAAVIIAAFQILFVPDRPIILVSEIVLMLTVLGIVWVGRRQRWHERWIDYRFLAERFRSALFMATANVDVAILKPPRHLSLSYSPKDWMVAAFYSVWRLKPRMPASSAYSLEGVKRFLSEGWIEDQIRYHETTSRRNAIRHQRMTMVSYILFGLTIAVVLIHIINAGPHYLETALAFCAVIFPAIAASVTAVRTHRDYLRNSMRYGEMARHLRELKDRMFHTKNHEEFFEVVKETEETMLHENADWRVVVRFHKIEVPV